MLETDRQTQAGYYVANEEVMKKFMQWKQK